MPNRIKNNLVHVPDEIWKASINIVGIRFIILMDNLFMLFEVFPDVSPVLFLVFKPFPEVCIHRWIRALLDFGVFLLWFGDLIFFFLLELHLVSFCFINDAHCLQIFDIKRWLLSYFEKMLNVFLLELIFICFDPLMQPIWILDWWYWIHAFMTNYRNNQDLILN